MSVFSTREQLEKIASYVRAYVRIPFFDSDAISGKAMEKIVAIVRDANVLNTYDYVDVVRRGDVGWQIKSTKAATPVTWKRAKIPNGAELIKASDNEIGLANVGKAIIEFCNEHAQQSIEQYKLTEIGYCRLIVFPDNRVIYFERSLCTAQDPEIFESNDFKWKWSAPKKTVVKEQLPALHGFWDTGAKAFAWHGHGENQLHFSGEGDWWPEIPKPKNLDELTFSKDGHAVSFMLPSEKVEWKRLLDFLAEPN